jgi:hypothetical protein
VDAVPARGTFDEEARMPALALLGEREKRVLVSLAGNRLLDGKIRLWPLFSRESARCRVLRYPES